MFVVLFAVLFPSILLEACRHMVNPVDEVVGLLGCGKWDVCQKAVDTVLAGGTLTPLPSALTLSLGPSGTSSGNDEKKLLNLFV